MYRRGTMDDKGPVVACIFAVVRLFTGGLEAQKKRIRIILGCDEESGWLCMERYAKTEKCPLWAFLPTPTSPL